MIWKEGMGGREAGLAYAKTLDGAHPGVRALECKLACYYRDCALYLLFYSSQDELDYYQAIINHLTGTDNRHPVG